MRVCVNCAVIALRRTCRTHTPSWQVDAELEAYHRSNAELDLLIGTLRQQLDEMQTRIADQRYVRSFTISTLASIFFLVPFEVNPPE
jgi:hypothetical protein